MSPPCHGRPELSPLEVRRLTRPGRWSVGGTDGLALQVTPSGARSWVLRVAAGGRQREMGLGSFPTVTLAEARNKARQHRVLLLICGVYGNVIRFLFPLTIEDSVFEEGLAILATAVQA